MMAKKRRVTVTVSRSRVDGSLSVDIHPEDAIIPDDKAQELLDRFFKMEEDELEHGRKLSELAMSIQIDE